MNKVKKIYLLPNLLTTANFFCGIWAITLIFKDMYHHAALVILLSMLFDFMDGHIARLSKAITPFGMQYDSLSDLVSFGVAPGLLVYRMIVSGTGRLGLGIFFIYAVSVALRLARYNATANTNEKKHFTGLPCPAAAGIIASSVLAAEKFHYNHLLIALPFLMVILAYVMVSNIPYQRLHSFIWKKDFLHLVFIVIAAAAFLFFAELCILVLFMGYFLSGIVQEIVLKTHQRKSWNKSVPPYSQRIKKKSSKLASNRTGERDS